MALNAKIFRPMQPSDEREYKGVSWDSTCSSNGARAFHRISTFRMPPTNRALHLFMQKYSRGSADVTIVECRKQCVLCSGPDYPTDVDNFACSQNQAAL